LSINRSSRAARVRLVAVIVTALSLAYPAVGRASTSQEEPSGAANQQADDAGRGGELEIDADAFKDQGGEVDDTLDDLADNVNGQLAQLDEAKAELVTAEHGVETAHATVEATEGRIADLTARSDAVVVEAFINPPTELSLDAFSVDSLSEATVKQSILDTQASESAVVLEELATAREELEVQQAEEQEVAGEAERAAQAAEAELADLESAQSQQALFVAQVQERLERNLAEADALAESDPELAAEIRSREGELASKVQEIRDDAAYAAALDALAKAQAEAEAEAQAEAERIAAASAAAQAANGDIGAASGSLETVPCPAGGSITVDGAMAPNLAAMLAAAADDGIELCGNGYRDPQQQINLRMQNCGTSYYAIYEMPSSQCSPPTARPGTSQHELGLAVDFTCNGSGIIQSQSSTCFQWLDAYAAAYGFYNLPSEPWHWSNDGT